MFRGEKSEYTEVFILLDKSSGLDVVIVVEVENFPTHMKSQDLQVTYIIEFNHIGPCKISGAGERRGRDIQLLT